MFAYTWEYRVRPGHIDDFKVAYGGGGDWAMLFKMGQGYFRTDLLEDMEHPGRFMTTDFWDSREDWEAMKRLNTREFDRIDKECERLTEDEKFMGFFELC